MQYGGENLCTRKDEQYEPIGTADASVAYWFLDEWAGGGSAQLYKIDGGFSAANYSAIRKAFVDKFGVPDERIPTVLRNRLGAQFEREMLIWRVADVVVMVAQYANNFGASDNYNMNFGEYTMLHVPSFRFVEQKVKEKRGGKL
jgi:hypothetical protein